MQHPSLIVRACRRFLLTGIPAALVLLLVGLALPAARGQTYKSLFSFPGSPDGADSEAAMVQGRDGFLYGTTAQGGKYGYGTVFTMKTNGTGYRTLHSFSNMGNDGANPYAALIQGQGQDTALYGTTEQGGKYGHGTVFKMKTDGTGFQTLRSFSNTGSEGAGPEAALIQGKDGLLYGTTYGGGASSYGTVFKIKTDGTGFLPIYNFSYSDGAGPESALLQGRDGFLYGTTSYGGYYGAGTVFKMKTNGTGFPPPLYSFSYYSDGAYPSTALVQGQGHDNALYGTTSDYGANGYGTVFKINIDGTGFLPLHSFGHSDGANPPAALVYGRDGWLYGTTYNGGTNGFVWGTVFKINPDGSGFRTLHSFIDNGSDGASPVAALAPAQDGSLYGTTSSGGNDGNGTMFKIGLSGLAITSLSPTSVPAAMAFTLTVNGAGFVNGSVVKWNGRALNTTFISANTLTAAVPAWVNGLLSAYPGAALISVVNPDGSSAIASLTITAPTPILTGINPGTRRAGLTGVTLSVTGSNFTSDAIVYFGSTALSTSFGSSGRLTATLPDNLLYTPGTYSVTVVQSGGTSNPINFTVTPGPALKRIVGTLARDANNNIVVPITIINTSASPMSNLQIVSSTLKGVKPTTSLPISLGNLGLGASASATLVFPGSAGSSGQSVTLSLTVSYQGGSLNFQGIVVLP